MNFSSALERLIDQRKVFACRTEEKLLIFYDFSNEKVYVNY